jgi:hypothetical protein
MIDTCGILGIPLRIDKARVLASSERDLGFVSHMGLVQLLSLGADALLDANGGSTSKCLSILCYGMPIKCTYWSSRDDLVDVSSLVSVSQRAREIRPNVGIAQAS